MPESKSVWRSVVTADDRAHIVRMNSFSKVTAVANAGIDAVEFWFEVFPDGEMTQREFRIYGTGHKIPVEAAYCGTAPRNDLGLVWHLYEVNRK